MQFSIAIIYDILLVILIIFVALAGKRSGLLAGLMDLVGTVAGFVAGIWATREWAPVIYRDYIGQQISSRIEAAIAESGGDISTALQGVEYLPQTLREQVSAAIQNVSGDVAPQVIEVLQPVILPLIQALLFLIVCIIVRWVCGLVAKWLRGFNHIPVLGTLNKALGFAFGFVAGIVDCWFVCLLLWLVAAVSMGHIDFISEATLGQSYIYAFFARFNPFLM